MLVNFSWVREGRVAAMGMPYGGAWDALEEAGVRAVLTLTEQPLPADEAAGAFARLHVPLVDFGTPSQEDLQCCVRWIEEQLAGGRPVVVHCFAGVGRTGTVIAAWLTTQGLDAADAIAELRRVRPGSVETPGQADAVSRFAAGREA